MTQQNPASTSPSSAKDNNGDVEHIVAQRVFLSNLRHDLRTPINAIIGYSEMLLEDLTGRGVSWQGLRADLEKIYSAGNQLLTLVNDSLHPTKIETGQLDSGLEALGSKLRHDLRTPINAITGYAEMLMEDATGLGAEEIIPDLQKIHKAAERFLGLINDVVNYIRIQAGEVVTIAATSEASAMLEDVATTIRAMETGTLAEPAGGGIILVVDDDSTNRDVLYRRLIRQGHQVVAAENGRLALDLLTRQRFDLVLLDIMMPEMNGFQVLHRIKSDPNLREIPVIMISALDEIESVVHCIEMGAEDHLPKPFNPVLLQARIGACLEKKRLRDKEVEYLNQVSQVTSAAAAVETENFTPESLNSVAGREDELGQLARVFQRMAREVYAREQRLKQQLQELRIRVDETQKAREVAQITETDYFQQLQQRAKQLREKK